MASLARRSIFSAASSSSESVGTWSGTQGRPPATAASKARPAMVLINLRVSVTQACTVLCKLKRRDTEMPADHRKNSKASITSQPSPWSITPWP